MEHHLRIISVAIQFAHYFFGTKDNAQDKTISIKNTTDEEEEDYSTSDSDEDDNNLFSKEGNSSDCSFSSSNATRFDVESLKKDSPAVAGKLQARDPSPESTSCHPEPPWSQENQQPPPKEETENEVWDEAMITGIKHCEVSYQRTSEAAAFSYFNYRRTYNSFFCALKIKGILYSYICMVYSFPTDCNSVQQQI